MPTRALARAAGLNRCAHAILPILTIIGLLLPGATSRGQSLNFTSVPAGFKAGSITLPKGFAGALGRAGDPATGEDSVFFAAVGGFGDMSLARVDIATGAATIIADGPFGAIGGIAVFSPTEIVLTDNDAAPGGPPDETILIARDNNPADGDFNDPGEITELIAPILADGGLAFTGAQAKIVPPGNPSGIPSGSLVVQTADGAGRSELLIVTDPLTAPVYRPAGSSYFAGFDYSGGFDFDSTGRIFMGAVEGVNFSGQVYGLVNSSADDHITSGTESHLLVSGEGGMGDVAIDAEDDVFFVGYNGSFAAALRSFRAPADALTGTSVPEDFAVTDGGYLTALLINSRHRPFEANAQGGATLVFSGFDASFAPVTNLLTLTPYYGRAVGDFDNSGCSDLNDFLYLVDNWQQDPGDGTVGMADFLNLLDHWQTGEGC